MTARYLFSVALLTGAVAAHSQDPGDARAEATYVFRGTVASASTTDELSVTVDEIYLQKGTFEDQTGRRVTVLDASALRNGAQYVFYTDPVQFAETIMVRLIEASDAGASRQSTTLDRDLAASSLRRELDQRVAQATVVVLGRVDRVRPLAQSPRRDSEHLPDFQLARVEIERVAKGEIATDSIEFVFAASRDVQWFRAPKFQVGDTGVFFLQTAGDEVAAFGVSRRRYTLLHPSDHRALSDAAQVDAALGRIEQ